MLKFPLKILSDNKFELQKQERSDSKLVWTSGKYERAGWVGLSKFNKVVGCFGHAFKKLSALNSSLHWVHYCFAGDLLEVSNIIN